VENSRRVNVIFSQSAYEVLEDLARRKGKSLSDTLRDAIALEKWFEDTRSEGGHVLIERDGRLRELVKI